MSAAELRQAASTLRDLAENATDHWQKDVVRLLTFPEDRRIVSVLNPGVGLVFADWLDQCADRLDRGHHTGSRHSHRAARLINGGAE